MIEDFYDKEFVILDRAQTSDGVGGFIDVWAERADSKFKGNLELTKEDEITASARKKNVTVYTLVCPVIPISTLERVRSDGKDYEINSVDNIFGHHLEIQLTEIEG